MPHIPHLLMPGNIGENETGEAIVTMLNVSSVGTPGVRREVKGSRNLTVVVKIMIPNANTNSYLEISSSCLPALARVSAVLCCGYSPAGRRRALPATRRLNPTRCHCHCTIFLG